MNDEKKTRRRPRAEKPDESLLVYGKVPPKDEAAERAVLGACLQHREAIELVLPILRPESFYVPEHSKVYSALLRLKEQGGKIDYILAASELERSGELLEVGGAHFIIGLTNSVASWAHVEQHAQLIHESYLKREQIRICGEGLQAAYDASTDAFEGLDKVASELGDLATRGVKAEAQHVGKLVVDRMQHIVDLTKRETTFTGVSTGFDPLDKLTGGWQNTDLIILAARPSVGKTAFALNLARNAAASPQKPVPVAVFSMEMSKERLTDRLLSAESGIELERIMLGKLDEPGLESLFKTGGAKVGQYPIYIDDSHGLNILELRAKARRLKSVNEIGLIIIDYLQLMSGMDNRSFNREQEISKISRGLKGLAKELDIPVIALSQLSRDIERRAGGKPMLSDLRESGAIEQDADVVIFLTREDYGETEREGDPQLKSMADLHIKKNRNGALDKLPMHTVLSIQRWMTPEQYRDFQNNQMLGGGRWKPLSIAPGTAAGNIAFNDKTPGPF